MFFIIISCLFFHRMIIQSTRLEFPVRLDATCCSGAPFLTHDVIEKAPREINSRITDLEWSTSMRTLQSVLMKLPSKGTSVSLALAFSLCFVGACLAAKEANIYEEFRLTIRRLNVLVFAPRGLYIAIELVKSGGCCGGQKPVLVVGLTPDECDLIRMGTGFQ